MSCDILVGLHKIADNAVTPRIPRWCKKELYLCSHAQEFQKQYHACRKIRRSERLQKSYGLSLGTLQAQKERSNGPKTFLAATPLGGETINNFITRLQKLAEH